MKTKGAGKGLGAVFGESASGSVLSDFDYVPIQLVEPKQDQPRSLFEQTKIDELADSIREHGVLLPLTVRAIDGGYYQIIAGERRWRAARAAGLLEIPIRVVIADDKKALELALVENLQREDLSPIEEARGFKALMDEFGLTQEDVAQRVSKSRPTVANTLRLLALPDAILESVISGELSAGSARALLALGDEALMLSAAKTIIEENLSVREVETLVKRLLKGKSGQGTADSEEPPGIQVDYIKEAQNTLTATLGRRVTIKAGKDKGKIELEYYGQDDFDELFDELSSKSGNTRFD